MRTIGQRVFLSWVNRLICSLITLVSERDVVMKPLDHRVLDHPYSDSGEVTIKADLNGHLTHPLDHAPFSTIDSPPRSGNLAASCKPMY